MEGPRSLATVISHHRDVNDPAGPIFYRIKTADGDTVDQVEEECLHEISAKQSPKQSPGPRVEARRRARHTSRFAFEKDVFG